MFGSPAAARNVGAQSRWDMISLETVARLDLAGPANERGHTVGALPPRVFFSLRKQVVPASGQEFRCGPLSVLYRTIVFSAMPSWSIRSRIAPTFWSWSIIVSW